MGLFKNGVGRPSNDTKKKRRILAFAAVGLVTLTVAFAALSKTLTINGSAEFKGKWDIHFEKYNEEDGIIINTKEYATATMPEIVEPAKVLINNYKITMKAPKDEVEYKFKIVNEGNIAAKISNVEMSNGTFTGNNEEIRSLIQSKLKCTFKYEETGDKVDIGDVIGAGDEQKVILTYYLEEFNYENNITDADKVTIDDLGLKIDYEQTDNSDISTAGDGEDLNYEKTSLVVMLGEDGSSYYGPSKSSLLESLKHSSELYDKFEETENGYLFTKENFNYTYLGQLPDDFVVSEDSFFTSLDGYFYYFFINGNMYYENMSDVDIPDDVSPAPTLFGYETHDSSEQTIK